MKEKRSSSFGLNVGGASILIVFVLLCLTTFATLSMVSAHADYKLTQQNAAASVRYYEADARAEEILSEVDALLVAAQDHVDPAYFWQELPAAFALQDDIQITFSEDSTPLVVYSTPIDETQELLVVLEPLYPTSSTERYHILEWKVITTAPLLMETEDEFLGLWDGAPLIVN